MSGTSTSSKDSGSTPRGARDGPSWRAITLPSRALDALLLLVERRGLVLDRATLVGSLWPDTIVSQNSLDQLMSQLRRAFANGKEKRSVIRTERGRGFRFDAPLGIRLVRRRALRDRAGRRRTLPISPVRSNCACRLAR